MMTLQRRAALVTTIIALTPLTSTTGRSLHPASVAAANLIQHGRVFKATTGSPEAAKAPSTGLCAPGYDLALAVTDLTPSGRAETTASHPQPEVQWKIVAGGNGGCVAAGIRETRGWQ